MHPIYSLPSSPSATEPCPSTEVLPLIEFVERQLGQIREAQSHHERHLAEAQQQSAFLDRREQELRHAWAGLEERQRWLQAHAADLERRAASVAASESVQGFDRMALLQHCRGLEESLERIAAEQRSLERDAEGLRAESGRLAAERTSLREEIAGLSRRRDELERSLAAARSELDAERARRGDLQRERKQALSELAAANSAMAKMEREAAAASARVEERAGEIDRLRKSHQTLEETVEALRARVRDRESDSAGTVAAAQARLAQAESELAALRATLPAREHALTRASDLESQLVAARESQRRSVESLQAALDAANERLSREASERKSLEARATAAESAAARDRGELAASAAKVERAESLAAALRRDLDLSARGAAEAQDRIRSLQRQLDAASGEAAAAPLRERIESLEARLAESGESTRSLEQRLADAALELGKATASRDRLEREFAEARERFEAERAELPAPAEVAAPEVPGLRAEIAMLSTRLAESEAKAAGLARKLEDRRSMSAPEGSSIDAAALQERVRQLAKIAALLRQRRDRLRKVRAALAIRRRGANERGTSATAPVGAGVLAELRQVQVKQEELRRGRKHLAECETRMIRRWSVHRGAGFAMLFTLFLAALGACSWMAADLMWPNAGSASVDLMARAPKGQVLAGAAAAEWRKWHADLLKDPRFIEQVAGRLAARGISPSEPAAVAAMFESGLRVDSDGPGRLRLVLAGDDRQALPRILDTLATSLATESLAAAPRRPDAAPAVVLGDRTRDGRLAYSLLDPQPLEARQFVRAGVIAGGTLLFAASIGLAATMLLRRTRRVVEDPESELAAA
jgi:chromosome segregation ATPase